MSRDPLLYLEDILEACEKIQQYMEGVTRKALTEDSMRFDAVVRNLELIGEGQPANCRNPSATRCQRYPGGR